METAPETTPMNKRPRGRPATGRKEVFQVPLDPAVIAKIKEYAEATESSAAEVARTMINRGVLRLEVPRSRK
jgi:hypothetical protein